MEEMKKGGNRHGRYVLLSVSADGRRKVLRQHRCVRQAAGDRQRAGRAGVPPDPAGPAVRGERKVQPKNQMS